MRLNHKDTKRAVRAFPGGSFFLPLRSGQDVAETSIRDNRISDGCLGNIAL